MKYCLLILILFSFLDCTFGISLNLMENVLDSSFLNEHSKDLASGKFNFVHLSSQNPSLECPGAEGTIFQNFPLVQGFLNSPEIVPEFLRELLCDGRNETVNTFVQLLQIISIPNVTLQEKDMFLTEIFKLLLNQTIDNPPFYVSHGTDHSINTMRFSLSLVSISQVRQGMLTNYGCSDVNSVTFVLMLNLLLHDLGYIDLGEHDVPKWLHSTSSQKMVQILLTESSNYIGSTILNNICSGGSRNLTEDFLEGIRIHNFDDSFCLWTNNNPNFLKKCAFTPSGDPNQPYSKTTPLLNGNVTYFRNYTIANALTLPFPFVARVSDNLHALRTRLTPLQRDPNFMEFMLRIYVDSQLRDAIVNGQENLVLPETRQRALDYVPSFKAKLNNITNPDHQLLESTVSKVNAESILHFYSNWIVESISFNASSNHINLGLYQVPGTLDFQLHPGLGLYQINRLASSMLSCYLEDGVSFLEAVMITTNLPVPDLSQLSNNLPAFSKKPIYDSNGIVVVNATVQRICGSNCKAMPYLTNSPEPCMDTSNNIESYYNNTAFGNVSPYSDLNYPENSPPNNQSGFLWYYVGIPLILISVTIIAIVIVLFIIKRKKRYQYISF